jgi:hypothetical protein
VLVDCGNIREITQLPGNLEAPMSPLTIFLAKLLGLYCIIVALAMMTRRESTIATMKALIANPPLLLFVEVFRLAGGLAMIIGHNIWSGGALPVVITLIGWLMAIRGAGLLALSPAATAAKKFRDARAFVPSRP